MGGVPISSRRQNPKNSPRRKKNDQKGAKTEQSNHGEERIFPVEIKNAETCIAGRKQENGPTISQNRIDLLRKLQMPGWVHPIDLATDPVNEFSSESIVGGGGHPATQENVVRFRPLSPDTSDAKGLRKKQCARLTIITWNSSNKKLDMSIVAF